MEPRVSVMMPAYNAAATLPLALASLAAQTYSDWQAIVVDDGSTDGTSDVVRSFGDHRVELIRFTSNRGRPHAREAALEAARGEYLCMLDADDWMYPERIARQVEVLDTTPEAAVVSAGMAIVGKRNELVAARCFGERGCAGLSGVYSPPSPPPIAHASSMLRRGAVGDIRPDPRLVRGQDTDFMMRLLSGRRYFLIPELLYAYTEIQSFTPKNLLMGHRLTRTVQAKYFGSHPVQSRINWSKALLKGAACRLLFAAGRGDVIVRKRSRPPSAEQSYKYDLALREVQRHLRKLP